MKTALVLKMICMTVTALCVSVYVSAAEPAGDTTVYHGGKKRVHVKGCKRLTKDPEELKKLTKMTYAEAKKKGLPLCSRCPGSATAGKSDLEKVTKEKNVSEGKVYVYKKEAGDRGEMEIHFPKNHDVNKPVPGIIMFHGGGWRKGNHSQFHDLCKYFASRGLVAATANYTLGKGKKACVTDAKSAIRWYKQNAKTLGVDPKRIITGGGSAGGHVSLLATTNPGLNDPNDPKDIDTSVVAYLLFNPALSPGDKKDDEIYLVNHLKADMPPMVAFWGTKDSWLKGWNEAHKKMTSLGTSVEWFSAEGQGHAFFNKQPWKDLTIAQADRFLKTHGFIEGKPTLSAPKDGAKLVRTAGNE